MELQKGRQKILKEDNQVSPNWNIQIDKRRKGAIAFVFKLTLVDTYERPNIADFLGSLRHLKHLR